MRSLSVPKAVAYISVVFTTNALLVGFDWWEHFTQLLPCSHMYASLGHGVQVCYCTGHIPVAVSPRCRHIFVSISQTLTTQG